MTCRYGALCKRHSGCEGCIPDGVERERDSDATVRWAECLCGQEVELALEGVDESHGVECLIYAAICVCHRRVALTVEIDLEHED